MLVMNAYRLRTTFQQLTQGES